MSDGSQQTGPARLNLELTTESLERVRSELIVTGFFKDELPLRGGVGRADWRLCGLISEQLVAGRIEGNWGEALMVPSQGHLRARCVLVIGLGSRQNYRLPQVEAGARDAVERALALGVSSLAMPPLGVDADDFPRCVDAFLQGAALGLSGQPRSLSLCVVLPEKDRSSASAALSEAIQRMNRPELIYRRRIETSSSPAPAPSGPATFTRSAG